VKEGHDFLPALPLLTSEFWTLTKSAVLCSLCAVVRVGRTPYWVWMSLMVTYRRELHLMFCQGKGARVKLACFFKLWRSLPSQFVLWGEFHVLHCATCQS